jgi:hypothetical protein
MHRQRNHPIVEIKVRTVAERLLLLLLRTQGKKRPRFNHQILSEVLTPSQREPLSTHLLSPQHLFGDSYNMLTFLFGIYCGMIVSLLVLDPEPFLLNPLQQFLNFVLDQIPGLSIDSFELPFDGGSFLDDIEPRP